MKDALCGSWLSTLVSGETLHDIELFHFENPPKINTKNSHASPTPLLEGGRVYVHFGTQGTAALTTAGEVLWKTRELRYYHRARLVRLARAGRRSASDQLRRLRPAIRRRPGERYRQGPLEELPWRLRAFLRHLARHRDRTRRATGESRRGARTVAYDVETGEELWWIRYKGFSNIPKPVTAHGLVYVTTGYFKPTLFAVRLGGSGDVTKSHIAWNYRKRRLAHSVAACRR